MKTVMSPVGKYLQENHMRRLGIGNTMRLASAYNKAKYRRAAAYRRDLYENHFDELLRENGEPISWPVEMKDGYAIDTSGKLPFLPELLDSAEKIIAAHGGVRRKETGAYRSYFQELPIEEDVKTYPALLDFALSSAVLSVVGQYLKTVPVMSSTLPRALRFVESSAEYDDSPNQPHDSQLYHVDYYSKPNVYILVLLEDVTPEKGPFSFLPVSASQKVAQGVKNWSRARGYRFSDEEVYRYADRKEMIEFAYPRGTVLFIESSGCFHYGSRNCILPRYQMMYGYSAITRTDFSEEYMAQQLYPTKPGDSRLRKLLLDKTYRE